MEYTPQGQLHPNCLARFRVPVFERWAGMQRFACWAIAKRESSLAMHGVMQFARGCCEL